MSKSNFNINNRTSNLIRTSFWGASKSVLDIILGFVYRTVFIYVLSAEYLGLNGLFSDILQVLSLAELGITTAIVYRFYKPISTGDFLQVGKLMNYLKKVYRYIAIIILGTGLALMPFIDFFINDSANIPSDVNIYYIYLLFLLNTVSSYLFAYRQTIFSADQRGYLVAAVGLITSIVRYSVQVAILFLFMDYSATLLASVIITIVSNFLLSSWAVKKYRDVFDVQVDLSREEKNEIINDTKAVMFHKVGATVKLSTDSIVLSKFVSIKSTGIYSNYSMIIIGLQTVMGQLLGSFVSSIGSAHVKLSNEENYSIYKKLLFIDLWLSSVVSVCTYLLLNDFIVLWIGKAYLFDKFTLIMLCLQFYIFISRQINISYTNGCGLFIRDRYRPIIEAVINLVLSIIGVKLWGIIGVFAGTVVSSVLTVFWREPYILYKEEFKQPVRKYWITYLGFLLFSFITCILGDFIKYKLIVIDSLVLFTAEVISVFLVLNILLFLIYRKSEEYVYMKQLFIKILQRKLDLNG